MRKSCVSPDGKFLVGTHNPVYKIKNLRSKKQIKELGECPDGSVVDNRVNFPEGDLFVSKADKIYEIPNPFPFKGTTFINSRWAETKVSNPELICLPEPNRVSLKESIEPMFAGKSDSISLKALYAKLPAPVLYSLAQTSTDPEELELLAKQSCCFVFDSKSEDPKGLAFESDSAGITKPRIKNHTLFEIVVNNHYLPDPYKNAMVLRPGIQGKSEIVSEWEMVENQSHVFEYLRRNSYIPWGHYAANMADDSIRYRLTDLSLLDMRGMRHLYYQRTYCRVASELGISLDEKEAMLDQDCLEQLRLKNVNQLKSEPSSKKLVFNRTLWGWNFGFDYSPSEYRLHASHQQIHQQYAMIPEMVPGEIGDLPSYASGDLIEDFAVAFETETGVTFFSAYLKAIKTNKRVDGRKNAPESLVIYEDEKVLLFVPKAQTSQWELQLMTLAPIGNVLEADSEMRESIDRGIYLAVKVLSALGAKMITSIEYSKRFNLTTLDQRLLYAFLPRLPESPGAFSEAQLRWINGHYPEDFAQACRHQVAKITKSL